MKSKFFLTALLIYSTLGNAGQYKHKLEWSCFHRQENGNVIRKFASPEECKTFSEGIFAKYDCQATVPRCKAKKNSIFEFRCQAQSNACVFAKFIKYGQEWKPECPRGYKPIYLGGETTAFFCYFPKKRGDSSTYVPNQESEKGATSAH